MNVTQELAMSKTFFGVFKVSTWSEVYVEWGLYATWCIAIKKIRFNLFLGSAMLLKNAVQIKKCTVKAMMCCLEEKTTFFLMLITRVLIPLWHSILSLSACEIKIKLMQTCACWHQEPLNALSSECKHWCRGSIDFLSEFCAHTQTLFVKIWKNWRSIGNP